MRPTPPRPTLWNILIDDGQASLAAGALAVMWTTTLIRLLEGRGIEVRILLFIIPLSILCIVWIARRRHVLRRRWEHDQQMRTVSVNFIYTGGNTADFYYYDENGRLRTGTYRPGAPNQPAPKVEDSPPEDQPDP
jgi:hypothetical protein